MSYKTIIGLEIHVELATKTKAFCSCENSYGGEPNTRVCPVCLGMPGALPVLSEGVVVEAVKAASAFHMQINHQSSFDRKNYFYPDLTKGFQITQDDHPVAEEGYLEIEVDGKAKKIGIYKIQIEEDTGKSLHTEEGSTLMDYNRCGVPLIEIVSKPEMNSGEEARMFLEKLRNTLRYIGVSDCKMEEGSLRCDVNINVKDEETGKKTVITEVKNLNSFKAVEKSIDYEVNRQIALLKSGQGEIRTTRRWDDVKNETIIMREKYSVNDYHFGPEGDLGPLFISDEWIQEIKSNMVELPDAKKERFIAKYKLNDYDAEVLTQNQGIADYFEEVAKKFKDTNMLSNWFMTEFLRRVEVDEDSQDLDIPFSADDFADLMNIIKEGKINNNAGKKVLRLMFESSDKPMLIIERESLLQMQDDTAMKDLVNKVLEANPESIEQYRAGKDRILGFLVGQVMKESRGKANPQMVNQMLSEVLKSE